MSASPEQNNLAICNASSSMEPKDDEEIILPNKRSKKLTSAVWLDFRKVKKGGKVLAICSHCEREFVSSASSGTTHLRKHLERCPRKTDAELASQVITIPEKNDDGTAVPLRSSKFDQHQSRFDLACLVIFHEYPFSIVEDPGFKIFFNNLQPSFELVSVETLKTDCQAIYEKEKQKLSETISGLTSRISITTNMWMSCQNAVYLCLAAHYIDEDWSLQRKILNFVVVEPPQTEDVLCEMIMSCLVDWKIHHKLFTVTVDNGSISGNVISRIKDQLYKKWMLMSDGQFFHMQCGAHVLSTMVKDCFQATHEVTHKIRESVKYVKSSQAREQKFNEAAQRAGVQCDKSLYLDVPAQWNTTYHMLEVACLYKDAFSYFQDSNYSSAPSNREWEMASDVASFLKLFYEIANVFSGTKYPTSSLYFFRLCGIKLRLDKSCSSLDSFVSSLASKMKEHFDKYWESCCTVLALAAILDPRFKMIVIDFWYPQIYGAAATNRIKHVQSGITNLYSEYVTHSPAALRFQEHSWDVKTENGDSSMFDDSDMLKGFDDFLQQTSQIQHSKSDLDRYLEEPVLPRTPDFNLLLWWKINAPKFPILSRMARDVLGIPVSTVASDTAFNTVGRVLDAYRSSLLPDTVQALICAQDWLHERFEGIARN